MTKLSAAVVPHFTIEETANGTIPTPAVGEQHLFVDDADHLLKTKDENALLRVAGSVEVTKASDESVNTSTTLQADDELIFTTVSGGVYEIELVVVYVSPVGGATPDIKVAVGEDATARGSFTIEGYTTADAAQITAFLANRTATGTSGTATTNRALILRGIYWANGGTFALMWAQNTSDANDVTVKAGSLLRYRRIL